MINDILQEREEREERSGTTPVCNVFPTLDSSVAPRAGSVAWWVLSQPALALVTSRGSV